jgi:hypothetical protein
MGASVSMGRWTGSVVLLLLLLLLLLLCSVSIALSWCATAGLVDESR